MFLMEDTQRLSHDLNIHNCSHIYREANRTTDCLAKKSICNIDSNIWWSNFPKDVLNFGFDDYCGSSFNRLCRFFHM